MDKVIENEDYGLVRLEIIEYGPDNRTLRLHLSDEVKAEFLSWKEQNDKNRELNERDVELYGPFPRKEKRYDFKNKGGHTPITIYARPVRRDTDFLYDLMDGVISNSGWSWMNAFDLAWLVDDELPILSQDHWVSDYGKLLWCDWAYALNNHSWVISGLEPDFEAGIVEFEGVHCQFLNVPGRSKMTDEARDLINKGGKFKVGPGIYVEFELTPEGMADFAAEVIKADQRYYNRDSFVRSRDHIRFEAELGDGRVTSLVVAHYGDEVWKDILDSEWAKGQTFND